jgi:hypothetical protein
VVDNWVPQQNIDENYTRKITTAFSWVALYLNSATVHVTSLSSFLFQQLHDVSLYFTPFNNSWGWGWGTSGRGSKRVTKIEADCRSLGLRDTSALNWVPPPATIAARLKMLPICETSEEQQMSSTQTHVCLAYAICLCKPSSILHCKDMSLNVNQKHKKIFCPCKEGDSSLNTVR